MTSLSGISKNWYLRVLLVYFVVLRADCILPFSDIHPQVSAFDACIAFTLVPFARRQRKKTCGSNSRTLPIIKSTKAFDILGGLQDRYKTFACSYL